MLLRNPKPQLEFGKKRYQIRRVAQGWIIVDAVTEMTIKPFRTYTKLSGAVEAKRLLQKNRPRRPA